MPMVGPFVRDPACHIPRPALWALVNCVPAMPQQHSALERSARVSSSTPLTPRSRFLSHHANSESVFCTAPPTQKRQGCPTRAARMPRHTWAECPRASGLMGYRVSSAAAVLAVMTSPLASAAFSPSPLVSGV